MHIHVHLHIHTYIHVHMNVHVYIHIPTHYMPRYMCIYMYNKYIHIHMHISTYTCTYSYTSTSTYTYTYIKPYMPRKTSTCLILCFSHTHKYKTAPQSICYGVCMSPHGGHKKCLAPHAGWFPVPKPQLITALGFTAQKAGSV